MTHKVRGEDLLEDPNAHPNPRDADEALASSIQCLLLGRIFYDGDRVCWSDNRIWVCGPGGWAPTDERC
jgi:hypothetical protein